MTDKPIPLWPLPREGDTYIIASDMDASPSETGAPLKLCPFCGDIVSLRAEICQPSHVNDKYCYVASIDHNCKGGIRAHGLELFYSDKNDAETVLIYTKMTENLVSAWNDRLLDDAIDKKYNQMNIAISQAIAILKRIAGHEIGIHRPNDLSKDDYYVSWDDGEYWIKQALHILTTTTEPTDE